MLVEFSLLSKIVVLFSIIVFVWIKKEKRRKLPPGPPSLPFLGNLLTIGGDPFLTYIKWAKKYGPIMTIAFGPQRGIVIHGLPLIKELLHDVTYSGRIHRDAFWFISGDERGIVNSQGDIWNEQRRFAIRTLKEFGFGKSSMEELIMCEVKDLVDWIHAHNTRPVSLLDRFSLAILNSLWNIVTGQRFDHDDPMLQSIMTEMKNAAEIVLNFEYGKNMFIFFYPQIGKLFPKISGWKKLEQGSDRRLKMFNEIIQEHIQTFQPNGPKDFIDMYLTEIYRTTNPQSTFHIQNGGFHSLISVMADLFVAGIDTTPVSLSWFILYLLHYPRVQRKVEAELDRVIGLNRNVYLNDRKCLPFTEAAILESTRLASIAPFLIPHSTTEDTKLQGYDIPKNSLIFPNVWALHHDQSIWGKDVEEFKPERFLNFDESCVIKREGFIPFSIGKRACPGETLAKDSLFLFATNLILNFEVSGIPGQKLPPLEWKKSQITLSPISSTVVMKPRHRTNKVWNKMNGVN